MPRFSRFRLSNRCQSIELLRFDYNVHPKREAAHFSRIELVKSLEKTQGERPLLSASLTTFLLAVRSSMGVDMLDSRFNTNKHPISGIPKGPSPITLAMLIDFLSGHRIASAPAANKSFQRISLITGDTENVDITTDGFERSPPFHMQESICVFDTGKQSIRFRSDNSHEGKHWSDFESIPRALPHS